MGTTVKAQLADGTEFDVRCVDLGYVPRHDGYKTSFMFDQRCFVAFYPCRQVMPLHWKEERAYSDLAQLQEAIGQPMVMV